ncbi:MAG: type II toxin-antitoxin system RelE/ParE family toxin [Treponema sp.]|nr:type II toxin-antitoxin system RelE/ParE family toxin [Treponema sp.]
MRVFKYTRFSRFASKEGITDQELLDVVKLLEEDQADANLGGDVFKVRIAREGEGKRGGHRIIVYFRNKFRTFFSYAFSKNDKGNISDKELKAFKKDAKSQFLLTDEQIETRLRDGTFIEIFEEEVHRVAMDSINITAHAVKKED